MNREGRVRWEWGEGSGWGHCKRTGTVRPAVQRARVLVDVGEGGGRAAPDRVRRFTQHISILIHSYLYLIFIDNFHQIG